jgi:dGTPase
MEATDVFLENQEAILSGNFNDTLVDNLATRTGALATVQEVSRKKIYDHDTVLQIEMAGYNVMAELLGMLVPALLKVKPSHKESTVLKLIPFQFTEFELTGNSYEKLLNALDFLSGMTDEYATEIYRRLKGISTPAHN